jgi:phage terminase large subunit GpA-like protein
MIQPAPVFQVIVVPGPGVVMFPDSRGAWWSMEVEHQRIALLVCVE